MAKEIPISSIDGLQEALDVSVAVKHRYANITTMIADQANQKAGQLIQVVDATDDPNVSTGSAYYDYTGATTPDLGDYFLVSTLETGTVTQGDGITVDVNTVKIGDSDLSNKITISNPEPSGQVVDGIKWWLDPAGSVKMQAFKYVGTSDQREVVDISTYKDGGQGDIMKAELWAYSNVAGSEYMGGLRVRQGYVEVGDLFSVGAFQQFKGLRYKQEYGTDIDWAGDSQLVPTQKRAQDITYVGKDKVVENEYADVAALLADQGNQTLNEFQYVIDASADPDVDSGFAYYKYLGTTVGDLTDYERKTLGGGAALETIQELTITDANYTDALALDANANVLKVTLDAALTNDWAPASISGAVEGRSYTIFIIKESDNGVDLSSTTGAHFDDDIDPFATLVDIDLTQKRATIPAVGFSTTDLQFGRMLITGSNYAEA